MRRLRYQVAASLDGFIATRDGGYDWIVADPAIDFVALHSQFDTAVMGRKTYEVVAAADAAALPDYDVIVFSRSQAPASRGRVTITHDDPVSVVSTLKTQPGRDIWLYGGGELFRTLLDAHLVDTVEIAIMPVLLGSGIPVVPAGAMATLKLVDQRVLPDSGIVVLAYLVGGSTAAAPRIQYVR
jgi:dihydrofolate reductase